MVDIGLRAIDNPNERRLNLLSLVTRQMHVAYVASCLVIIWAFLSRR